MENNNVVVTSSSRDKLDCFAWVSKSKCNALNSKNCKNCSFYKPRSEVSNYQKYFIEKNHLKKLKKTLSREEKYEDRQKE